MEYGKIIAVTGLPGLYELLSSKNDGGIIRSLDDKSTRFVTSRKHNFSHLESIEVYTQRENVNLADVFQAIEKAGKKLPDGKDATELKKYFEEVFPELDFERVYNSDLKKMVKWYQILKSNNIDIKLSEPEAEVVEEEKSEVVAEEPVKKTAKKTEKKVTEEEEKPKKKAAAKKTADAASAKKAADEPDAKKTAKKSTKKKAE